MSYGCKSRRGFAVAPCYSASLLLYYSCRYQNVMGTSQSRVVAILFRQQLSVTVNQMNVDSEGNFLVLDTKIGEDRFLLVNVYGPNQDKPGLYSNLKTELGKY